MKGLFKSKPRTPVEMVQHLHELLVFVLGNTETREKKRAEKIGELDKLLLDIRTVLFGDGQIEPNAEACAQVTKEFFQKDTFRLLINCLPSLDSGARQNATHVIANLQRQRVNSKVIASEYLENNLDIMDILVPGYEDSDIAWTYGAILRECIRHQNVARYVLESDHMKKFFGYLQNPNFDIASDVQATFKFFQEYNSQLLQSESYITRRHAVKLLGDMLLDRSNSAVMVRYVTSLDHMRIMMNLLRDSNKTIKLDTFHVFKLFVANHNKPPEIISVLLNY
ncbi:Mo25 family protein [Gossypium australe]|uniref:Mo25 family protein n=1 Tax=Gossypium australe TaxID=47621 RepID=A0A5B6VQK1_9ROSI|nr:Mo25 family protein [Gossypium australe]